MTKLPYDAGVCIKLFVSYVLEGEKVRISLLLMTYGSYGWFTSDRYPDYDSETSKKLTLEWLDNGFERY